MDERESEIDLCPVCGDSDLAIWATARDAEYRTTGEERFTYLKCARCGSLILSPMPTERLHIIYPANYYSFAHSQDSILFRIKLALDRRWFRSMTGALRGESLTALDVGGGAGWQLNILREADPRFSTTDVVDLDAAAEKEAVKNGHSYFCGRIEEYQTARRYDIILMLNLIEHVSDPICILRKVGELLSPQGVILLKTPNVESLDAWIFRHHDWGGYHSPRHWVLFNRESLQLAIGSAGLMCKTISYTQGAPFWAASVMSVLEKKGLVSITSERPVVYHPIYGLVMALFAGFDFVRGVVSKTSQMFAVISKKDPN